MGFAIHRAKDMLCIHVSMCVPLAPLQPDNLPVSSADIYPVYSESGAYCDGYSDWYENFLSDIGRKKKAMWNYMCIAWDFVDSQ